MLTRDVPTLPLRWLIEAQNRAGRAEDLDEEACREEEHRQHQRREMEAEERRRLENEEMARHFEKHPHG